MLCKTKKKALWNGNGYIDGNEGMNCKAVYIFVSCYYIM